MNNNIIFAMSAALLCISAQSCKEDSYQPGPETAAGSVSAYFTSSNEANVIITPEEYAVSDILTLTVKRKIADEAVSVPVIVTYKDDALEIPSEVKFGAGEAESSLEIKMNNLEKKKTYAYSIRLGDDYADHYSVLDGSDVFTGTVLVTRWLKVVEDGVFYYSGNVFPYVYSDIWWLDGQDRFYIGNFLGSGIDLGFRIKHYDKTGKNTFSPSDTTTWNGVFEPTDHYLNGANGSYSGWWLMSDVTNEDYAYWTPEGSTLGIDYIHFYNADGYAEIYLAGKKEDDKGWEYGGWLTPYIYYSDSSDGWSSLSFWWEGVTDFLNE